MRPVLFYLFGFPVGAYGFFMTLAHLVGLFFLLRLARGGKLPLGTLVDLAFAVMAAGLVGARLGYAYNYWGEFRDEPARLLSLTKGGLSFYGGFAPAFFAFVAVLRWRRVPVLATGDLVSPLLPLSLGLVRIGCFLQGCCYGAPTASPLGVAFSRLDSKIPMALIDRHLHPTQLYEAAFLFLLAGSLFALRERRIFRPGVLATLSIFAYSAYRLGADFLRGDLERGFWGVPWMGPTQAAAILGILATPLVLWICRKAARGQPRHQPPLRS